MKNRNIVLITFLIVIISVFTSGCTVPISKNTNMTISNDGISFDTANSSSTSENVNKTFSKEGITFNYPGNWSEFPNWINILISGDYNEIGMLNGPENNTNIVIQKYSLSYLGVNSVEEFQNQSMEFMNNSNSTILITNKTSVNGLIIYETITYDHNPDNTTQKTLFVTTGKNQTIYVLQFYSDPKLFDKYLLVFNKIVSTIKIQ